jgi:hypothetical protein
VELPDEYSAEEPALADLPGDWNLVPPGPGSMDFGGAWARDNRSLILYVPSVLVPEERNAILNPNHPEFTKVKMRIERNFHYDRRMYLPRRRPTASVSPHYARTDTTLTPTLSLSEGEGALFGTLAPEGGEGRVRGSTGRGTRVRE